MLDRLREEAGRRGVRQLWLHASDLGKPVYERFGFAETDRYMELKLPIPV